MKSNARSSSSHTVSFRARQIRKLLCDNVMRRSAKESLFFFSTNRLPGRDRAHIPSFMQTRPNVKTLNVSFDGAQPASFGTELY